ncbi:ATP-binding protein [Actinoplanes sp. NPDC051633]|uniref:ATP-binding protein n=1 Tax=Actinoplanes sp. NPDC051633 TaxID=3155670 RepID=UPI00341B479F
MQRRVAAGIAVLLVLFVALVVVQMVVGEGMQNARMRHADRLDEARAANKDILQHMTDAETGVRGFQLTGARTFLSPYDSGRVGAFTAFDHVDALAPDAEVRRLLVAERAAASHWLYAYAVPIVNAGVADRDEARAARAREWFNEIRTANAAVDAAIRAEQQSVAAADRRRARTVQILLAGLAMTFIAVGLTMAAALQRHQLAPLEHIRRTLQRLASGDRSARAVPSGTRELRAVIGTLNELAAETERLLADEQARTRRTELRQAVAAELRSHRDPHQIGIRVAEMLAGAFGADAVHGRAAIDAAAIDVSWPADADPLPAAVAGAILDAPGLEAGVPLRGALAVPLGGDAACAPGLVCLIRHDGPQWTAEERQHVEAVAREIEYAVGQERLHTRQARLIRELRALDGRKDDFVATVTHELRTPLTSILGYAEMLGEDEDLTPPQRRGLEAILRNAVRLQETVADLLLLGPAGQRDHAAAPVDLAAVTSAVAAEVVVAARTKGVLLTVDAGPAWVNGDAEQLERAVRNLLDNAVKFTPAGGSITCRVTGGGPSAGPSAELEITDTGIGVPLADQPGLFTPFHRGANAMDQAVQGSGLGLAIVRNIVTEHGGAISVHSVPGSGSTFTMTLPAAVPSAASV